MRSQKIICSLALIALVGLCASPAAHAWVQCGSGGNQRYCETDGGGNAGSISAPGMSGSVSIGPIVNCCAQNEGMSASTSQNCVPGGGYCTAQLKVYDTRNNAQVYASSVCTTNNCTFNTGHLPIRGMFARAVVTAGHQTGLTTSEGIELTTTFIGDQCCTGTPGVCKSCFYDDNNSCTTWTEGYGCDFNRGCLENACQRGESCSGGYCGYCEIDGESGACRCH